MGSAMMVGSDEGAAVRAAVARLQARGVSRSGAVRRVARHQGTSVRYVRKVLAGGEGDAPAAWGL